MMVDVPTYTHRGTGFESHTTRYARVPAPLRSLMIDVPTCTHRGYGSPNGDYPTQPSASGTRGFETHPLTSLEDGHTIGQVKVLQCLLVWTKSCRLMYLVKWPA